MSDEHPASRASWWRAPLARLAGWREQRALERRAIPDDLWALTVARLPFVARLGEDDRDALRRMCSLFLDDKPFVGAGGVSVTDDIALAIAAQACLPVLHLGLHYYRGVTGIVLHPDEMIAPREEMDEDGVVHEYETSLTGELDPNGILTLNWLDILETAEAAEQGYNVVIHEFVHAIDAATGEIDGVPPLPDQAAREHWMEVIDEAYETFCDMVDAGLDTVVDPYGAEAVDEFFPVAVEAFFVDSIAFRREWPQLYVLFADYFRQDPAPH